MSSHADRDYSSIYFSSKPAIVQAAEVRNCAWWKQHLAKLAVEVTTKAKEYREAVRQFKASGSWIAEFKTWDQCTKSVLGISRQRAHQLLEDITENCPDSSQSISSSPLDVVALQSSPKTHEDRPLQSNVKDRESAPEPTPKTALQTTTIQADSGVKAQPPRDETGELIPQRCLSMWNTREEVQPWMHMASQLKCFIQGLGQSPGGNYSPLSGQTISLQKSATDIFRWLELCKPYAVCYACRGSGEYAKDQCAVCYGAGLISRNTWNDDWTIVGMSSNKSMEVQRRAALKG